MSGPVRSSVASASFSRCSLRAFAVHRARGRFGLPGRACACLSAGSLGACCPYCSPRCRLPAPSRRPAGVLLSWLARRAHRLVSGIWRSRTWASSGYNSP